MSSDWVFFIRTNSVFICEADQEGEEIAVDVYEELDEEFENRDDEFQLSIDEVIMKSERK